MSEREVVINGDEKPTQGDEDVVNGDEKPIQEDEAVVNGESGSETTGSNDTSIESWIRDGDPSSMEEAIGQGGGSGTQEGVTIQIL
ncbi:hypothetical protein GGR55DRAFT_683364 [Xylaria sp. FL0064]|nr:hypothetical protein GGR55DRAFT_684658 [Xylaria sp. FL0064]KAI0802425.1 hypothetical protein GGR55DRAFT_683364 [Xylaria sp. FL0064]